jgi:hypothetical protein
VVGRAFIRLTVCIVPVNVLADMHTGWSRHPSEHQLLIHAKQ